jgi:rhodanese-related sulfurtransferase
MAQTITRDALKAKLDSKAGVVLVEALPEKYFRHSHLPGALNIPHDQIVEPDQ